MFVPAPARLSRRRVVIAAGTSTALTAISAMISDLVRGASAQETSPDSFTVALDWYPNANHAGLFLGQERGYYADEGLAPEFYTPSDPTTVLQTVGAGRDTFGISYQTDILLARAAEVPVVSVLALVQTPLQGIMVLADSGIARPADLIAKTVGYPGIPSQEAFLATMLESDGATMADVELVNIGFNLTPALISGQVDASLGAFWTHEPILAAQEGSPPARRRSPTAPIWSNVSCVPPGAAMKMPSPTPRRPSRRCKRPVPIWMSPSKRRVSPCSSRSGPPAMSPSARRPPNAGMPTPPG
jgi:ABC-type nitrate/sulfonate/bicarbonate transport system substrate-binding protein